MLNASPRWWRLRMLSKMARETKTAVNRFASRPKRQCHSESADRTGSEQEQDDGRNDGRDVRIDNGEPGMTEALLHR